MKKVKYLLLVLTIIMLLPIGVLAKEKINVYLFKRDGCGFCANALSFFTELSKEEEYQNYFNLVAKDVVKNKVDSDLMARAAKHFGLELNGVPFIVIGDQTFEGYSNTFDDQIKEAIKNAYEQESDDVIASLTNKKDTTSITIVILLAVGAGLGFLVYMAKANDTEETIENEFKPKKSNTNKKKTSNKK